MKNIVADIFTLFILSIILFSAFVLGIYVRGVDIKHEINDEVTIRMALAIESGMITVNQDRVNELKKTRIKKSSESFLVQAVTHEAGVKSEDYFGVLNSNTNDMDSSIFYDNTCTNQKPPEEG